MNYLPIKLTKLRKHYNYSQSFVADFLNIDTIAYMNYENGSDMLNYSQMKKLASLYSVSVVDIFRNDEDVPLHKINSNTDELNAKFFMPEHNLKNTVKGFIINHKLASGIIGVLVLAIIVLSVVLNTAVTPYTINKEDINRLSVSDTTVIYIDDTGAIGFSGSNSNGQLNDLVTTSAIKVCEGDSFSAVLLEDGTILSSGLIEKSAKSVSEWKNIVDIAAGGSHIVAVDSNGRTYCVGNEEACEIAGTRNIKKVFASKNASILLDNEGMITYSGNLAGSSVLKDVENIIDIDSSNNILVFLDKNGVNVFAKTGSYIKAESWSDIVDVTCGDDFVAGLDSYGKVHIEIDDITIKEEVEDWNDIICIDSGSDYLIGYDGKNIYGVGNNFYEQFKKENKKKFTLEKVSDIEYTLDEENITIQFNGVSNASGYLVSLNVGTGKSNRVESAVPVSFSTENMIEGKTYTIDIVSIGGGNYKDSDEALLEFVYERPNMVEVNLSEYIGKPDHELDAYLYELGMRGNRNVSENDCGEYRLVESIDNFVDGKYNLDSLKGLEVEYTCCRVN